MIQISDKSGKISASGVELAGGAWNKQSIGVFLTKELEDRKLCFAGVTAFLLNGYIPLRLNPPWITLKSMEQFQANLNKRAKLYWLITRPVKWLNMFPTLFQPAFNGPKTDRSSGCNKCDECEGRQYSSIWDSSAASIKSMVTCTFKPSNNSSKGRSAEENFRKCSWNYFRYMSFDIHQDFWPWNIVDSSAPSVTYFGILPDKDL